MTPLVWIELPAHTRRLGQPVIVWLREPTLAEFVEGIPDVADAEESRAATQLGVPERPEVRQAWRDWFNGVTARAIVEPAFLRDPARLGELGTDRDLLVTRVIDLWGLGRRVPYRNHVLVRLARYARELGMHPTDLLEMPAGKFWQNEAILFDPEAGDG